MTTIIKTSAQLDALLTRGVKPLEKVVIEAGTYQMTRQCKLKGGASVIGTGKPTITWAGPANSAMALFSLTEKDCTVSGLTLKCGGCDAFNLTGTNQAISLNRASDCNDFAQLGAGGKYFVRDNIAPMVANYAVYIGGRKDIVNGRVLLTPVDGVEIVNNQFGGSVWMHTLRFHDAWNIVVKGNKLARSNDGDHDGCIGKIHDGRNIVFEANTLLGGSGDSAYIVFGPLGGGDGGLRKPPGPLRDWQLAQQLDGLVFRKNICGNVVVRFFPGAKNIRIDGNALDRCKNIIFDYKPTESYTVDGVKHPGDYRQWRGEITGSITNNLMTFSAGTVKPWTNVPAAVTRTGNRVAGKAVS